jgi:dihydrolipoamide dehydrogenase
MVVGEFTMEVDVAVIGGGPGGYVAAIRAADLGLNTVLIEEKERLGGTCLLEGCIPSKTLIHVVELADSAKHADKIGLIFKGLEYDLDKLRNWTNSVVETLSGGVNTLVTKRGIEVIHGHAEFKDNRHLHIDGANTSIEFKNAIIATGSVINQLPSGYNLPLWSSAEALQVPFVPEKLLVIGGGYIGLEMGLVYAGLGSQVSVVEPHPHLLFLADQDMVEVMINCCYKKFANVMTGSKVTGVEKSSNGFVVTIETEGKELKEEYQQVLVAIGRKPNTENLGLENTKIELEQRHIPTNEECRTIEPNIFAIGDVAPGMMLAHKASREAHVAAEVIAKHPASMDNRAVPAVVFTDPEIAWVGLTEIEASQKNITYKKGVFPLTALGRARSIGRTDGFVKILSDPQTQAVLGVGIVGPQASELIAEGTLAIEMGATLEDLMVTIHPHPTLSEALMEAAEVAADQPVHILPKKKK